MREGEGGERRLSAKTLRGEGEGEGDHFAEN